MSNEVFLALSSDRRQRKWTMDAISKELAISKAVDLNDAYSMPIEWSNDYQLNPSTDSPLSIAFDPLSDGDVGELGSTRMWFCPELLMDIGCLKEDASRLLDLHGSSKYWQQWKVRNALLSLTMASSIIASLAMLGKNAFDAPFSLGNCLPRSILFPFSGMEPKGCRYMLSDDRLPKEYNATSLNTLAFLERSEEMSSSERWANGNASAEYIKLHERVSNVTDNVFRLDSSSGKWISEKFWVSRQNLYSATPKTKQMVLEAWKGNLHFIEVDCRDIKKWFLDNYVEASTGKLDRSRRINARKDFPEIWKKWTGLRPFGNASAPVERYATFSSALNAQEEDILSGAVVWTTHLEKILRGMLLGDDRGMTLQELSKCKERRTSPIVLFDERPSPNIIRNDEMSINVEFDKMAVEDLMENGHLDKARHCQLQALVANGKKYKDHSWIRLHFRRKSHGRFYGYGNSMQSLPKWIRRKVFPAYASIDLNCGVYSIMAGQLQEQNYDGQMNEIKAMVEDRNSYRNCLVDETLDISLKNVKSFLTMIGYGCTIDVGKIVDAAEWNWLVEAYGIEPTLYETYRHSPGTALASGINDPHRLMQIAKWASNPKVVGLWNEMQEGGKFLFKRKTSIEHGRPVLWNAWGEKMDVKSKRTSFGRKLAHIYQGAESMLLWKIMDGFDAGSGLVKDSMYGFGIPMHDGFGLHKDLIKEDPSVLVEKYVRESFGWSLKYECE